MAYQTLQTLPKDCPMLDKHNQLRNLIMGLNPELMERFGPDAKVDVQRVNPQSIDYQVTGFRWFVILPWPQISGEEHRKLAEYVMDKIISFDTSIGAESFGSMRAVAGGAIAFIVGLREKQPVTT